MAEKTVAELLREAAAALEERSSGMQGPKQRPTCLHRIAPEKGTQTGVSVQLVTVLTGDHQPNALLVVVATAADGNREKTRSCPCECLFDLFSIKCRKHTHLIRIWSLIGGNLSRRTILKETYYTTSAVFQYPYCPHLLGGRLS